MSIEKLKIMLDPHAFLPMRAHAADAGLDLFAPYKVTIQPGERETIDTGVHLRIPDGYVGLLTSKSGLMKYYGITCRGTIDAGYTGSIQPVLFNHSKHVIQLKRGDKITQLVIMPIETPDLEIVDQLDETERGASGFGSTGYSLVTEKEPSLGNLTICHGDIIRDCHKRKSTLQYVNKILRQNLPKISSIKTFVFRCFPLIFSVFLMSL